MEIKEYIELALKILKIKSLYLFAISVATFVACLLLAIGASFDKSIFGEGAQRTCPWLLIAAIMLLVIALFKRHAEQNIKTVQLVPTGHECVAHVAIQPDKRKFTQIICYLDIFNLTEENIWLTQIKLVKPKTHALYIHRMISVKQQQGPYSGGYEIPPRGKTDGGGHIMMDADIVDKIRKEGVIFKIADQYGHWHTLKFPTVKII
jgi:hypothetical protein